jgi:N-acetylmuramoyl-L-alanine amidase
MKKQIVVLDAGHGKKNALRGGKKWRHSFIGMHEAGWFYEGWFNRDLCDKLRVLLERDGVEVVFTHDATRDTPLGQRTKIANAAGADMLVSIHANAAGSANAGRARGFEIFAMPANNAGVQLGDAIYREVLRQFGDRIRYRHATTHRFTKEGNFQILRETRAKIPFGVLVECLFFDNIDDAKILIDEKDQWNFAISIHRGIMKILKGS